MRIDININNEHIKTPVFNIVLKDSIQLEELKNVIREACNKSYELGKSLCFA